MATNQYWLFSEIGALSHYESSIVSLNTLLMLLLSAVLRKEP